MKRVVKELGKNLEDASAAKIDCADNDQSQKLCSSDTEESYNLSSSQMNRCLESSFSRKFMQDSIQVNNSMKQKLHVKVKRQKTVKKSIIPYKRSSLRADKTLMFIYQHGLAFDGTQKLNVKDTSDEEYELSDIEIFSPKKRVRAPCLYNNLCRETKPFELKDVRVVLRKLKMDPNTAKIVSPINCIKSQKHTSNSSLTSNKISKSSLPKQAPLKMKSLRILLHKLNVGPERGGISWWIPLAPLKNVKIKKPPKAPSPNFICCKRADRKKAGKKWWVPFNPVSHLKNPQSLESPTSAFICQKWWIPVTPVSQFKNRRSRLSHRPSLEKAPMKMRSLGVEKLKVGTPKANVISNLATPRYIHQDDRQSILEYKSVKSSINTPFHEKVPKKLKSFRMTLKKWEIDTKIANACSEPFTPRCFPQDVLPLSLLQNYKRFESSINTNNASYLNSVPFTSTPVVPSKKLHLEFIETLNSSPITAKPLKGTSKQDFTFEYSNHINVLTPVETNCRTLNPAKMKIFSIASSIKARSEIERSIFLSSQTSTKKVSANDSILTQFLDICNQTEITPFHEIYEWRKITVRKVGEGSFGEVFMITKKMESFIIKVIQVSEDGSNSLQSLSSIYSEVKVSKCLSELRFNKDYTTKNFSFLKGVHIVRGCYPLDMRRACYSYGTAYEDVPGDANSLFIVLEVEYGGQDLFSFKLRNACEAESLFKQVALSLAIAEEVHLFEHRDMHVGNILVKRIYNCKSIKYTFRGENICIDSQGLFVTIIDFTLSRILDCGVVYYNDLAQDTDLFNQTGDIQFDIYKATKYQLKNQWHECLLYSNVLWLEYLCKKLLNKRFYRPTSIQHKKGKRHLKVYVKKMSKCKSAVECLNACNIIQVLDDIVNKNSLL